METSLFNSSKKHESILSQEDISDLLSGILNEVEGLERYFNDEIVGSNSVYYLRSFKTKIDQFLYPQSLKDEFSKSPVVNSIISVINNIVENNCSKITEYLIELIKSKDVKASDCLDSSILELKFEEDICSNPLFFLPAMYNTNIKRNYYEQMDVFSMSSLILSDDEIKRFILIIKGNILSYFDVPLKDMAKYYSFELVACLYLRYFMEKEMYSYYDSLMSIVKIKAVHVYDSVLRVEANK